MQVSIRVTGLAQHKALVTCQHLAAMKVQYVAASAGTWSLERSFTAYGSELRRVKVFKYLGRHLASDDYDVPVMCHNLRKARSVWVRIARVLDKEGVPAPAGRMFYQTVVVVVRLYGSESWCLPSLALDVLEGFHVVAARRITGIRPRKRGATWIYPKSALILKAVRLMMMMEYVAARRQTVAALAVGRPVLGECQRTEMRRGTATRPLWWDQDIEWEAAYEATAKNTRGPDSDMDSE